MLLSLAIIFLVGLSAAAIFNTLKLPRIIGMLLTGIVAGPYVLDLLDPSILGISSELRQIALKPVRSEKSRQTSCAYVISACLL